MFPAARSLLAVLLAGFVSVRAAKAEVGEVDDESVVLLLQTSAGLQRHSSVQPQAQSPADRLGIALPLVYVHVPKTGSSIANALLRLPGVCPDLADELGEDSFVVGSRLDQFAAFQNMSLCPGLVAPPSASSGYVRSQSFGDHMPLGDDGHFEEYYDGHAVTMLRQPEQRVISGLRHAADLMETEVESLQFSEGCTVRMLVGDGEAFYRLAPSDNWFACFALPAGDPPLPEVSTEDIAEAVARLRRFAFVGIQEEWHLSVCLLHAMFGGECSAAEFMNTRPSVATQEAPELYDTSILGSWVDAADRAVYDAGFEIFQALRAAHGVTPESCQPCYRSAGLS